MRKICLFLLILMIFPSLGFAQKDAEITQFLPHFVVGSLSDSDWESKILLVNLAGEENTITADFFDNFGNPLIVSTNKGVSSSFVVVLPKPDFDSVSSDVLEIFRNTGSFVTGWVKVRSKKAFGADLEFRQFLPGGTDPVGKANVSSSPVENVLTYPLAPNNAIVLVNPGSQDANINFTAFDRGGNKLKEGKFILARGGHMSTFFNQTPFFLDATGIVVVASNIPLSGIALDFEGLVFKTIPRISTPRRLDLQKSGNKIGFVYIHSDDRQPQPGIRDRLAEYVKFQQSLLDKEMPINGLNHVQLPYDLDENGFPKVEIINAGNRDQYFNYQKNGFERMRYDVFLKAINDKVPSYWEKFVVFADMWLDNEVNGQKNDVVISALGNYSIISARYLPFLSAKYFGDKRPYRGIPIPEFGGKIMPYGGSYGNTFEDLADSSIALVNHESGHAFWFLRHSDFGPNSRFVSMMGSTYQDGCMNIARQVECVLLPIEANGISIGKISKSNDFEWIPDDFSPPAVEILSKEIKGDKLILAFKAEDLESGINSFSIETVNLAPWARYWRLVNHFDNLDYVVLETDVSGASTGINLIVLNNKGNFSLVKLF